MRSESDRYKLQKLLFTGVHFVDPSAGITNVSSRDSLKVTSKLGLPNWSYYLWVIMRVNR